MEDAPKSKRSKVSKEGPGLGTKGKDGEVFWEVGIWIWYYGREVLGRFWLTWWGFM